MHELRERKEEREQKETKDEEKNYVHAGEQQEEAASRALVLRDTQCGPVSARRRLNAWQRLYPYQGTG